MFSFFEISMPEKPHLKRLIIDFECSIVGRNFKLSIISMCLYCAGKHISKTCNLKTMPDEHKCSNCLKNTSLDIRKQAKSHISSTPQCPLLIREQEKAMLKTKIFTKN